MPIKLVWKLFLKSRWRKFKSQLSGKDTDESPRDGWKYPLETVRGVGEDLMRQKENVDRRKNEIAFSLAQGQPQEELLHQVRQYMKEDRAKIALQIIITSCDGILLNLDSIQNQRKGPEDESHRRFIHNLVFAASRDLDISALKSLIDIFERGFGKKFVAQGTTLQVGNHVNPQLITCLSTANPTMEEQLSTLNTIADENNIDRRFYLPP